MDLTDYPDFGDDWVDDIDDEPEEPFTDGPRKHTYVRFGGWAAGIAWFIDADDGQGTLRAHMVGDDREHIFYEQDVLETLDEDGICSCGQIGCNALGLLS